MHRHPSCTRRRHAHTASYCVCARFPVCMEDDDCERGSANPEKHSAWYLRFELHPCIRARTHIHTTDTMTQRDNDTPTQSHIHTHTHACMHATCTRALHPYARTSILNPSANASTHDAHAPCVRAHICTHAYRMDTRAPRRSVSGWPSLLKGLRHSRHLWPRSACNTNLIVWVPV